MKHYFIQRYERLIRFILVGGGISLAYSMLTAFLIAGPLALSRIGASLIASIVVIPASFAAHKRITYRGTTRARHRSTRFALLAVVNLFINVADMALTDALHWPFWIALVAGWVIVPGVNFILNTLWVFRAGQLLALDHDGRV